MLAASIPTRFPIPFGNSAGAGFIRPIPTLSQIGIQAGAASLTDGFPPVTFIATSAGGTPPFGQDFNGLLNQVTLWSQWQAAGNAVVYNSAFSTAIGGYPQGAILASTVAGLYWLSTADNNTTDPDGGSPANWVAFLTTQSTSVIYSGTDTGSANAYHLTTTSPITPSAYFTGMIVEFIAVHANTTASTIQIAGLAAKSLVNANGAPLVSGAISAGQPIFAVYNGTSFVSMSALSGSTLVAPQVTVLSAGATGTYTTPTGALYLVVEMVGGGGSGSVDTVSGNGGSASTFGASLTANGGGNGRAGNGTAASGGTATGGDINITGGTSGIVFYPAAADYGGGAGGQAGGPLAGPAGQFTGSPTGNSGVAGGIGSGGSGGAKNSGTNPSQGGGGAGYLRKLISSPLATYAYTVGQGGAAVTSTVSSGAGGGGQIVVTAYFQ